jgi:6-methylpretetramide 4-monooxygenase / 4-hydroxy-6-methylpretetramide 12a-monooxygenase
MNEHETDLLIIGGGPTGLAAACEGLRHGLRVRLVERRDARAELSKALVVHARTLEVLETMGCADEVVKAGQRFAALNVRPSVGASPIRIDLLARAWGDTRFPYWLSIPQFDVEKILERRLEALGGRVEWGTSLTQLEQLGEGMRATLSTPGGSTATHTARWVLACDGGRSDARTLAGLSLDREALNVTFALTDVWTNCDLVEDEGHVVLSPDGVLLVVPMPEKRLWRLIAQVPANFEPSDVQAWSRLVQARLGVDLRIDRQGWNSRFDLTGGVADRFRKGDLFLLGDAAHVHSPVGGQGLNTGVQDANNLVWKLALLRHEPLAAASMGRLLDSYERERKPIAQAMVKMTGFATRVLTLVNPVARFVRGLVARVLLRTRRFQDRLSRGVGMLDLESDGHPRLQNPQLADGSRLHDRVDTRKPTLLRWAGHEVLIRPDRVVADRALVPEALAVRVEVAS